MTKSSSSMMVTFLDQSCGIYIKIEAWEECNVTCAPVWYWPSFTIRFHLQQDLTKVVWTLLNVQQGWLAKTHVSVALGYHPSTMPVILKMCSQSYSRGSGSIIKLQFPLLPGGNWPCYLPMLFLVLVQYLGTTPPPCPSAYSITRMDSQSLEGTKLALPSH